jgi:hypothetical protein
VTRIWDVLGPTPDKSAYRQVGSARFPVDDNPVSQDLGCFRANTRLGSLDVLSNPSSLLGGMKPS